MVLRGTQSAKAVQPEVEQILQERKSLEDAQQVRDPGVEARVEPGMEPKGGARGGSRGGARAGGRGGAMGGGRGKILGRSGSGPRVRPVGRFRNGPRRKLGQTLGQT